MNHKKDEYSEELQKQATSLRIESGLRIDRAELLAAILSQLEKNYQDVKKNDFSQIITKWKKRCQQFGQEIVIAQDDRTRRGIFEDIDGSGCLLLRTQAGERIKIVAGDVAF